MLALLEAAGAFLLALVGIFAAGRLWFALVEAVKDAVLRRARRGGPEPWHPLPPEEGEDGEGP